MKNVVHKVSCFLPLLLLGVALAVVHREIEIHNLGDISRAIYDTSQGAIAFAVFLTVLNYLVLAGYDALALRYAGHKNIAFPKILLTSLIGYAISNNTGHAWASGGSVRYRFYTAWGVPGWDIVKISVFLGMTYLVGVMTMGAGATLFLPDDVRAHVENPGIISMMGAACAAGLSLYWGLILFRRKPVVVKGVEIALPSPLAALGQTIVSCIDLLLAGLVLWAFLPGHVSFGFETFLIIFLLAQVAGLLSQVPGGIGVFEGAFLWLLGGTADKGEHLAVIGALVLYRAVYYFLPLAVAGASLLAYEFHVRRGAIGEKAQAVGRILGGIVPQIFAFLLVLTGGILLVSGATPAVPANMQWLRGLVPLPVVEISHLLGSLVGLLLLFLARGIYLRLDAAWYGGLILLGIGIAASLLKGFDWQEAAALLFMLLLFLPARRYFRRRSSLFSMRLSWPWAGMVVAVLAGSTWLGFFAFRHIAYSDELWWQFSYHGDAPRFLRALLLIAVVVTGYMIARLLSAAASRDLFLPGPEEMDRAEKLIRASSETQGFLALLGDKKLFWAEDESAFVMFADTPRYWIAMGNPVGAESAFETLLWRFREEADRHGADVVFYEAGEKFLPLYLDLGLSPLKTGEEAKVRLPGFALKARQRKACARFLAQNFTFSVLDRGQVGENLPALREISDRWLAGKNTREKRFSLGFFDESYIARMRVGIVRNPEGRIVAFANLWETGGKEELSIDLMRYDPEAPGGIMEFLFLQLMLWGSAQEYAWFGLGMAPLAGLERHPLAPLWYKIGAMVYDFGEEFYNFQGLHDYKAKFDPVWFPRYLAVPAGGLSAPLILITIAKLVAGGWKGVFVK